MAGSVRVVINTEGVRELLRSTEVRQDLRRRADAIARAAGGEPDFVADDQVMSHRARASVRTATPEGMRAEETDRALTKAIDAGRE